MHERLAPQNAEEGIAHGFGLIDSAVEHVDIDLGLLGCYVNPATLAAQITAIDNRNVKERGKELASLKTSLVLLHTAQPLPPGLIGEFPQQSFVGFPEQPISHAKVHRKCFLCRKGHCPAAATVSGNAVMYFIARARNIPAS